MAYSLWLRMTTLRRAVRIGDRPIGLGLADLARILLDVDEEVEVGLRPGQAGGVQADELDALRDAGLDRILQAGGVGEHRDAVRLQRDRLVHAGEPRRRAALAVDDGDLPAELLAGLLDVDAVEMGDVVLLVAGQEDDLLARVGLRRRGRTFPCGLRSGISWRPRPWRRRRRRRAPRVARGIMAAQRRPVRVPASRALRPCHVLSLGFPPCCVPRFADRWRELVDSWPPALAAAARANDRAAAAGRCFPAAPFGDLDAAQQQAGRLLADLAGIDLDVVSAGR